MRLPMIAASLCLFFVIGCTIQTYQPPVVYRNQVAPTMETDGPAATVVDVEPDPVERVYIYEPGFPPGVYSYDGFYFYRGYRYEHTVFMERIVRVNIRANRFVNVAENRRIGQKIEVQHKIEYARTGGKPMSRTAGSSTPARPDQYKPNDSRSQQQGKPQQLQTPKPGQSQDANQQQPPKKKKKNPNDPDQN